MPRSVGDTFSVSLPSQHTQAFFLEAEQKLLIQEILPGSIEHLLSLLLAFLQGTGPFFLRKLAPPSLVSPSSSSVISRNFFTAPLLKTTPFHLSVEAALLADLETLPFLSPSAPF